MKIMDIETLLLQEMEDVKGGVAGTCQCVSGAGQSTEIGGKCICTKGAKQLDNDDTDTDGDDDDGTVCKCEKGAGL